MQDLIVIKFGGSLITEKTSRLPKAKLEAIEKIADIVTHRPLAASYKPESII